MATSLNNSKTLTGTIRNIRFHKEDNGWSILDAVDSEGKPHIIVGVCFKPTAGMKFDAQGEFVTDPKFGDQFKFKSIEFSQPEDENGIVRYLASGVLPGVGSKIAERIFEAFGEETYSVISKTPERLSSINGISEKGVTAIKEAWTEEERTRDLRTFLMKYGIGPKTAIKITKEIPGITVNMIQLDPYIITQVSGVGFKTADAIAQNLGIADDDKARIKAGLLFVLQASEHFGHNFAYQDVLVSETSRLLSLKDNDLINSAIIDMMMKGEIARESVADRVAIYLKKMQGYEQDVAKQVIHLRDNQYAVDVDLTESEIELYEKQNKIKLADSQIAALKEMAANKVSILTGGPGTGKTTIVKAYLSIMGRRTNKDSMTLAAPTGRAAQRLAESTGRDASTVHRTLSFNPGEGRFKYNKNNKLEGRVFVLDESSMMGQKMMAKFITALPDNAHLLLVGDTDQLPSVESGQVLRDLIKSGEIPIAKLTEVMRQSKDSKIVSAAHDIINNKIPTLSEDIDDDLFIRQSKNENAQADVISMVTQVLPAQGYDPVKDVQVLTPMHRGDLGTTELNTLLQKALNPNVGTGIKRFDSFEFCLGDKVLQTRNNYELEIFNGDVGFITRVENELGRIVIDFSGKSVELKSAEMDDLTLAYAMTIHKSQGSEYPAVVMPLTKDHKVMLRRELVYTGLTRGKKKVAMVGDKSAFEYAINNHHQDARLIRNTNLADRIKKLADEKELNKRSRLVSMFGRNMRP